MINILFCTVLPPGASKVDQNHKFDDFKNLIQCFPKTPYNVLVEMKVVRNYVFTVFTLGVSEVGKIQLFRRKNRFLVKFRGS